MQPRPVVEFLDRFLSKQLLAAPPHELRRARVLLGFSLLMQTLLVTLTLHAAWHRLPSVWSTLFAIPVWMAVLPLLRFGYERLARVGVAVFGQLAMLFVMLHRDSVHLLYSAWQPALVMIAMYLVGVEFGAASLAVAIGEMIAIPLLARHGWTIEAPFMVEKGSTLPEAATAFLAIFGLSWIYSSARDEAKVALEEALKTISESREQYRLIAEGTDAVPFSYDLKQRRFLYVGPRAESLFGWSLAEWHAEGFIDRMFPAEESARVRGEVARASPGQRMQFECRAHSARRQDSHVIRLIIMLGGDPDAPRVNGLFLDITDLRYLEAELRQAQKLESVGRLAAGVAHEINTPVQFVSDSIHFVQDSLRGIFPLLGTSAPGAPALPRVSGPAATAGAGQPDADLDLEYAIKNIPRALDRSIDGLERIANIVRSMKEFAHPNERGMAYTDLNRAIENTLVIAHGEYKLVATVEARYGDIRRVACYPSEINQVLLNILVNAAHAIEDAVRGTQEKGVITVETAQEGEEVVISIRDTGRGIPEAIRYRVFDPFFTTKEVGRGTGQGLAIARSVVQEMHGGKLSFETELDKGTTFTIRLPVHGKHAPNGGASQSADPLS